MSDGLVIFVDGEVFEGVDGVVLRVAHLLVLVNQILLVATLHLAVTLPSLRTSPHLLSLLPIQYLSIVTQHLL